MPAGKPNFLAVINFPKIVDLVKEKGEPVVLLSLSIMVRNFCGSLNVQRNMNEDQILETALMLLNECNNFRLEDYLMMFEMGKKGELVKIYERMDIGIITEMADIYFDRRLKARDEHIEGETNMLDSLGPLARLNDKESPYEEKRNEKINSLGSVFGQMKEYFRPKEELKNPYDGKTGTDGPE